MSASILSELDPPKMSMQPWQSPFFSTSDSSLSEAPEGRFSPRSPLADQTARHVEIVGENGLADVLSLPDRPDLLPAFNGRMGVRQASSKRRIVCLSMAPTSAQNALHGLMDGRHRSLRYFLLIRLSPLQSRPLFNQLPASCFSVNPSTCFAASLNWIFPHPP